MVLKLYRGETCLRTIYNVIKVQSEEHGVVNVINKGNQGLQTKCYSFNKDFHRFIITVD